MRINNTHWIVALLALVLVAPAQAQETPGGELPQKTFGGTSPLVIPASDFAPDGLDADAYIWNTFGYWSGKDGATGCLRAPAYLPEGAWVYRIWASFLDRDGARSGTVQLTKVPNMGGSSVGMGLVTSDDSADFVPDWEYDGTITSQTVTYPENNYYVSACFNSYDIRLYQVWIDFVEYHLFSDDFETGNMSHWDSNASKNLVDSGPEPTDVEEPNWEAYDDPGAMASKEIVYGSPRAISAAAFRPNGYTEAGNPESQYGVVFNFDYGEWRGTTTSYTRTLVAPLVLPDGATISDIYVNYHDSDSGSGVGTCSPPADDVKFDLYRADKGDGSSVIMATHTPSGTPGDTFFHLDDADISYRTIDSSYNYSMSLRVCSNKHELHGVLVYYTLP